MDAFLGKTATDKSTAATASRMHMAMQVRYEGDGRFRFLIRLGRLHDQPRDKEVDWQLQDIVLARSVRAAEPDEIFQLVRCVQKRVEIPEAARAVGNFGVIVPDLKRAVSLDVNPGSIRQFHNARLTIGDYKIAANMLR
jgi:hypothetical protein